MSQQDLHTIAVLGSSYAALKVAHLLLDAIPGLKSQTKKDYKVVMVANSTKLWWSVGAPRAMFKPFPKTNDDSFVDVAKGFTKYSSDVFEFIHAEITNVNTSSREVVYKIMDDQETCSADESSLKFGSLVIALGTTGSDPLFAIKGGYKPTLAAYEDTQARIPTAKSVMVIGGGASGVETAAELGHMYGSKSKSPKDITLVSGSDRVLKALRADISAKAEDTLKQAGVKVVNNVRFDAAEKQADGTTQVTLADGSKHSVDILIQALGRKPASAPLPKEILNEKGFVETDDKLSIPSVELAYATGDIAACSPGGVLHVKTLAPVAAQNLIAELSGKTTKLKQWKPLTPKMSQLVTLGPTGGVAQLNEWWLPSIAVKFIKSKDFMFPQAEKTVAGLG